MAELEDVRLAALLVPAQQSYARARARARARSVVIAPASLVREPVTPTPVTARGKDSHSPHRPAPDELVHLHGLAEETEVAFGIGGECNWRSRCCELRHGTPIRNASCSSGGAMPW